MYPIDEFTNNEQQFVPLNVLSNEVNDTGYFNSNSKWITISLWFLVYPLIFWIVMQLRLPLMVAIAMFAIYTVIYIYILRYKVLEEGRLRKQLRDMESNQLGDITYFYGIDKVGTDGVNDGRIFYRRPAGSGKIINGFVVSFDKGSIVNVPENYIDLYRETKGEFLRKVANAHYDFRWYEVANRPGLSDGLKRYNDILENIANPLARKVLGANIQYISDATLLSEQHYVNYIIVTNTTTAQLREMRTNLEAMVRVTFGANAYTRTNARILNHKEVQEFFEDYYMQDDINIGNSMTLAKYKPFSTYAKVVNVFDKDGKLIPLEIYNNLHSGDLKQNQSTVDLEGIISKNNEAKVKRERLRVKRQQQELDTILRERNTEKITDIEYQNKRKEILAKYDKATYDPDAERKRKQREADERKAIRQAEIKTERERKQREADERARAQALGEGNRKKKWYDDGEAKNEVVFDFDDAKAEKVLSKNTDDDGFNLDDLFSAKKEIKSNKNDDDLSLEDILNGIDVKSKK